MGALIWTVGALRLVVAGGAAAFLASAMSAEPVADRLQLPTPPADQCSSVPRLQTVSNEGKRFISCAIATRSYGDGFLRIKYVS